MKNLEKLAEKKMEQILLDGGYVELDELKASLNESQISGKTLEAVLIDKGSLDEDSLAHALCSELQLPFLSMENHPVSAELIQEIPKSLMVKYQFIPLDQFDNILSILIASTFNMDMLTEIQSETQNTLVLYIGLMSQLRMTIDEYITEEEQEAINTEVIPEEAQVTAGWESIFDVADQEVMDELKQKAADSGLHSYSSTDVSTSDSQQYTGDISASESQQYTGNISASESQQYSGEYTREHPDNANEQISQESELAKLEEQLKKDPFDYDAVNQYVAISLSLGNMESAIQQLLRFANGLEQAGDVEGAVNCYHYILELDPNNEVSNKKIRMLNKG